MKLFSIFMLVFTLGGFASGYSQKQVVTLNLKQCDVNTLLQEIWETNRVAGSFITNRMSPD